MKFIIHTPKQSLNKSFLKQRPLRSDIDLFKNNLTRLLSKVDEIEREENQKTHIRDFLRDTFYANSNEINTKDSKDLVIHLGKSNKDKVGVIIEAKRPGNKSEMVSAARPNVKAFHELILYYFNERAKGGNNELKQLVITNVYEWFIIDANYFDKVIYRNSSIRKLYDTYCNDKKDTPFFYEEVSKIISLIGSEIPCTYFDIREYALILKLESKSADKSLIALYKILSPYHLLKIPFADDSNKLNASFYKELLHIIGLEEAKENGKFLIRRKLKGRDAGSLIENAINILETEDVMRKVPDINNYGNDKEERLFNIALELSITWINRILFLKLLEGQLVNYHKGDKQYRFLHTAMIHDFDELYKLFHQVLARTLADRSEAVKQKYSRIPYLNSSLFEINELEDQTIKINSLDGSLKLPLISTTVLQEDKKNIISGALSTLDYLFKFLDAFDFASEGTEDIQEDSKTLINASVLGKVFEKINGYKDGSIFTPGFITMYMCRESIRLAVVQKFKSTYGWNIEQFDDIKNYIADRKSTKDILEFNAVINSLRICDPAVGSGHFLVSGLNELIAIKYELGLLADKTGARIRDYEITVGSDELIVTDANGDIFEYISPLLRKGAGSEASQRLQETLFHEKQTIIENCLFGIDTNPNSVKICRLRLWIELLKNAYYHTEPGHTLPFQLETLPNIDINIKCGNSLLSRFALDADLNKALKSIKYNVEQYRDFVATYKNEKNRGVKRGLQKIIDAIKNDFRTEISNNDPKQIRLKKLSGELFTLLNQTSMFELSAKQKKSEKEKQQKLEAGINKLSAEIEEIKNNAVYKHAFEWRFEFPEVLNNDGDFEGFDMLIGNPPYIQIQKLNEETKNALAQQQFETFTKTGDIYQLFYEQGIRLLKKNGQLSYITSNKWMRTDYGKGTRNLLANKYRTTLMIDFGMTQLFESATTYTNILLLEKNAPNPTIRMCRVKDDYDENILLEDYVDFAAVELDNPGDKSWITYDKKESELIKKIIEQGRPLKEWNIQINRGILTGFNEAFIINTETRDRLVAEDPKSDEIIKPILRGEDIKAYVPQWAGRWIIFVPWHFPLQNNNSISGSSIEAEKLFAQNYPAIFKHLEKYKSKLSARNKAETGIRYEWYALQRWGANYYQDFLKPKIIYPNMTKFMPFVYDKHQFFTNQKCFIVTGDFLSYLTAFLNSKIFRFTFKEYFPELLGDTRELSKVFFETVAVKIVDEQSNQMFDAWIETIIELKSQGKSTKHIEQEIEVKLGEVYSLSETEMRLIDSSETIDGKTFPDTIALSECVNS